MKKTILIIIVCIFLLPFNVFAEDSYIVTNEIYVEYNVDEQIVLNSIPQIGSYVAYLVEPTTGKVIYEKNAHEKMYPASTTKILTALVVLENCEITDTAIVSKNAIDLVPKEYTTAYLKAGEELSIESLLYVLLIPSANDAANVLAEHVSGSIEEFAELCNNRAKELGCETLHFVNPSGIHSEEHYCSAYDLYLIAKECQEYDIFNKIVSTKRYTLPASNVYSKYDRVFENTNQLILSNSKEYYYPYCTGIKTGYTTPAGGCLIASSTKDNFNLICIVLGGEQDNQKLDERFSDTIKLFNFAYDNYTYKIIRKYEKIESPTIKYIEDNQDTTDNLFLFKIITASYIFLLILIFIVTIIFSFHKKDK